MQTLSEIRKLLEERGIRPKHALGQNFLIDHNLIRKLVDSARVGPGDLVLEIGPGTGTMTEALLETGCRVIACELDSDLCGLLRDRFAGEERLRIIEGSCLASKRTLNTEVVEALGDERFCLVSNLPYGAGTPVLLALLTGHMACRSFHITVQREVGQRLLARAGEDAYGSISIVAHVASEFRVLATLGAGCFWPRPRVESMMLCGVRKDGVEVDLRALADFCQMLFTQRRRQLGRACRTLGLDLPPELDSGARVGGLCPCEVVGLLEAQGRSPGTG